MADKAKVAVSPSPNTLYGLRNIKSHNSENKKPQKHTPLRSPVLETEISASKSNTSSKLNKILSGYGDDKNESKNQSDKNVFNFSGRKSDLEKESFNSKISKLKFDILNSSNTKDNGRYTPILTQNDKKESKLSRKISVNLWDNNNNDYQNTNYGLFPTNKNKAMTTLLKVSSFKNVCSSKGKSVRIQNKIISPPNKIKKNLSINARLEKNLSSSSSNTPQSSSKLQRFQILKLKMENYIVI